MLKLKAEIVNLFIESSIAVLEGMTEEHHSGYFSLGDVYIATMKVSDFDLNISTMLSGDLEGRMVFSMALNTAMRLSEDIIGVDVNAFDELAQGCIVEVIESANEEISSRAKNSGYGLLTTPCILSYGRNESIGYKDFPQSLCLPLMNSNGTIELDLLVSKADPNMLVK